MLGVHTFGTEDRTLLKPYPHMKYIYALAACFAATSTVNAQECSSGRYTEPNHFPDVTVTTAVQFGSNTAVAGGTQILRMDVYEPTGDVLQDRPVVIVAFGGSFVGGDRSQVADLCRRFAKLGYVAVANDYRVGFFLPNEATTTRAVMRGSHDMKACVRFLRKTVAEDGNPYRIDPDRIIVGGVSAGAISAIHAAYLDQESEIPAILQGEAASLGGVEGNSGTPGYSSDVLAVYSFSGAIGDTLWIEPGDHPLASVHENGDGTVPYGTQEVSVIGIPTGLIASGSRDIHVRTNSLGIDNCLLTYNANAHVGYLNSDPEISTGFVAQFMADLVCGQTVTCGNISTGVQELEADRLLSVCPNPTNGLVQFEVEGSTRVALFDMSGREMLSERHASGIVRMDISGLPEGVYVLRAEGAIVRTARVLKVD
jgi:para-nitrobenzyl esterase